MTDAHSGGPPAAIAPPLSRDRNFAWMIGGSMVSMLGDQCSLIALPWLVLQMTGDTLMLGVVLGLVSLPRALFILVGGALVDRHSPKRVLMRSKQVSAVLLLVLAGLLLGGGLSLWMVYLLAFGLGLASAFGIPSGTSLLPQVVARERLPAANSAMLGLRQLSMFIGPLLAGGLILWFGDAQAAAVSDARGLGLAFLLDAFSFVLSAWTLSKVRLREQAAPPSGQGPRSAVLAAVAEGLRWCWNDRPLRASFLYWGGVALLIYGPIHIALPVLADQQPALGAAAFGLLTGAHGAGTLLGMVVSGVRPGLRARNLGTTLLLVDLLIGLLFMPLGCISALWQGMALLLVIGLFGGYMQVAVFTWLQQRVPPALLGRAMSLFLFIFMGLAPLSAAVSGWFMRHVSVAQLFAASGALLVAMVLLTLAGSRMREITDLPQAAREG